MIICVNGSDRVILHVLFCKEVETTNHLFITCSFVRSVWGVFDIALGTSYCPNFLWQSISWFHRFLPGLRNFIFERKFISDQTNVLFDSELVNSSDKGARAKGADAGSKNNRAGGK